jgi:hypothetical protein
VTILDASNAKSRAVAMKPISITSFHDRPAAAMSHQI